MRRERDRQFQPSSQNMGLLKAARTHLGMCPHAELRKDYRHLWVQQSRIYKEDKVRRIKPPWKG